MGGARLFVLASTRTHTDADKKKQLKIYFI